MSTPNTLTSFMPTLFKGLNMVNNEPTDCISAVSINSSLEMAASNQTITFPIATDASNYVITPGAATPDINGATPGTGTLVLNNSYANSFKYTEEDRHQLQIGGIYSDYYADQVAKSIRQLRIQVEQSITGLYNYACRADSSSGTGGTTPFNTVNSGGNSTMIDFALINKMFNQNGTPKYDRHLILDPSAAANLQAYQTNLFRVNEAGNDDFLRNGSIGRVQGLACGVSDYINTTTFYGTADGTGNTVSAAAAGATTITVTGGSGTILAGDIVHFGTDTTKYVVKSALATPGTGTFTINAPGLRTAIGATYVRVYQANYTANMAFSRDAITLVARQPILGTQGGNLLDTRIVKDPNSPLTYQMSLWQQYRQQFIEFALVWGVAVTNPQNLVTLIG